MRTASILCVAAVLFTLLVPNQIRNRVLAGQKRSPTPTAATRRGCLAEGEVWNEVNKLSSADSYPEQAKVVNLLMKDSRKSSLCRKRLISSLVKAMDKPDLDLEHDRGSFYLWHYGSEMLSDLKATEALDFLIAYLALHDGTPFPLNHHPAMVAVVRMGKIAMPNLEAALRKTRDPSLRRHIVFCIGWLGGPSTRKVLTEALSVENDPCARSFISATLVALNNKHHPNQITSSDRLKWYAAFRCNGNT